MKLITCFSFFLFTNFLYSQQSLFKEENISISKQFVNSEILSRNSITDRYSELTRSEGFLVNDVSEMGSVYTKKLHRSGKVIFNCQAGIYLNQIKSLLLKNYPKLDSLIHVYVSEDPSLNAFATVNNSIYVNIGLLARVENEAQLAFVLSHEIMHIVDEHIIKGTLKVNREAKTYTKSNVGLDNEMLLLRHHEVSREFEIEADLDGLNLFVKQDYNLNEVLKVMNLLDNADDYTISVLENQKLFFLDGESYKKLKEDFDKYILAKAEKDKKKKSKALNATHPSIVERLEKMNKELESIQVRESAKKSFIISESMFLAVKKEANDIIHNLYAADKDFLSLFLYTSSNITQQNEVSDDNLKYLGYSIQGLLFDYMNKYKIPEDHSQNEADLMFSYFYKNAKKDEFAKWAYHTIDTLDKTYKSNILSKYKHAIKQNIFNGRPKNLTYIFGSDSLNEEKNELSKGLNLDKIPFEISAFSDMRARKVSEFNDFEKSGKISNEKLAIIGMNLIHMGKEGLFNADYFLDLQKVEVMERHSDKVCSYLQKDYPNKVITLVPNEVSYSGNEYETYDKLNAWMSERLYFNNADYVSIYENEMNEISKNQGIKYIMSSVNIGVKSFSFKSLYLSYFSPFIMPIYLPQIVTHIFASSTRKYQLSLAFDIKTGDLVFWDKRTYLDPNTTAQLYIVNNDILNNFFHE